MRKYAGLLLVLGSLMGLLAAPAYGILQPDGDIDGDHSIDGIDLQRLAQRWLDPACLVPGCDEDLDDKDGVNAADLALLARFWGAKGTNLVINEFMAVNKYAHYAIVEGQSESSDWIEIYNPGPKDVNLAGWFLTDEDDELAKWPFPGIILGAGEYLLVFASDIKSHDHPTNYPYFDGVHYHTNFQLDGGGEYLALVDPHRYIIHEYRSNEYGFERFGYPPQQQDVSYGLYAGAEKYLASPTPGAANTSGYAEMSGQPWFSRPAGTFVNSFQLTLTTPAPGAFIRYTTNGSIPTASSAQYAVPITINAVTEVIARVFEFGKAPGPFVSKTYVALASNVQNFSSDIPVVVVDTYGGGIGGSSYRKCSAVFIERPIMGGRVRITDAANFAGRCGIRVRGSSTAGAPKKQFSFETWDHQNRDENISVLGLPADSDWILYAPLNYDRALINNPLAYEMSNQVGRYAVRTRACELYLNTGGGKVTQNDYWGLYYFMEKIRINKDRLDISSLKPWDSTEPKVSGGYVLAIDRPDPDPGDNGFRTSRGTGLFNYIDTPETQLTSTQKSWIRGYLDEFEDTLYGSDFADPLNGYAKYIDVGSHIDHSWLNLLPLNVDAFRLSGYMFKKRAGKLHAGPIWDFDRAFDSTDNRDDNPRAWDNSGGSSFFGYVWYARLHQDIDFWQRYIDRWYELRQGPFSTNTINNTIDTMAEEIREAAARNYARWSGYGPRFGGFQGEIDHIKDWLYLRSTWIDVQFVRPPQITPDSGYLNAGAAVTLTNPNGSGTIYYTLDGSDPREFGGSSGETITLLPEDAPKKVLVPTGPVSDDWKGANEPFDDSTWTHGSFIPDKTGGVGYDENPGYKPYITYDVEQLMNGDLTATANTTCYVRIPFTVTAEDLARMQSLTLKVRADDAFIAYLNGADPDLARTTNAPANPAWNSASNGTGPEGAGFKIYNITSRISDLKLGANILALHGLNAGTTSSDFVISAEIEMGLATENDSNTPGAVSPRAIQYTGAPITLSKSTQIKARVLVGSNSYSPWSGLATAEFGITPVAESLRITEIMYHPEDTGDPNDPNEEFIELKNISTGPINLNRVRFTNGIYFTFGDVDLPANEYLVLVKNRTAFEAQYPAFEGLIAGQYAGSLENAGERIALEDAIGKTIHDFKYKDGWRKLTDGRGFSLTIIDPTQTASDTADEYLVAHWKFDDASGPTALDSIGTNHGALQGDAHWTAGHLAGALALDGGGDYVSLAPVSALAAENITASAWIRMGATLGVWAPILMQHIPGADGYYFYVYQDKPAFSLISGGVTAVASSPEKISIDEWHHIAATNDAANLRIFVDGELKAAGASAGRTATSYDAVIGYDSFTASYYNGLIDDMRIYDRPLRAADLAGTTDLLESWNRKDSWRPSAYPGGSPGYDDSGIIPNPGAVVINEILAHSHAAAADWIELYNTTDAQIDIGSWYLTDSNANPMKYRFAGGTKIDAHGYLLLYEDDNFGPSAPDAGRLEGFAFSENGDRCYLQSGEAGALTGYRTTEDFGASPTGVSFGRYFKRSTGNTNFVAMSSNTPGAPNAYPKVGPVVINEIMYNPQSGDRNREYIELHNFGPTDVTLFDSDEGKPWKFTDGVSYTFPRRPGVTIPAGGYLLVVKNMASYLAEYGLPPFGVLLLGPYAGSLSDGGEKLQLSIPGDVDEYGIRHYIRADRVNYSDGSHPQNVPGGVDLWPTEPDAAGASLTRVDPAQYGNDPNNWTATPHTPGQ